MRILEHGDRMDWWLTRPWYIRLAPRILMMLLLLVIVAGVGAMIRTGPEAPSSWAGSSDAVSLAPPGGAEIQQQTAPVSVSSITEEKEVLAGQAVAQAPSEAELRNYERTIADEVNNRRIAAGLKPLIYDNKIATIALAHSHDMALRNYTGHNTPEGKTLQDRLRGGGENIAYPPIIDTPLGAVIMWENSPKHHANFLSPLYTHTGVGIAIGYSSVYGTRYYVTQDFT